MFAHEITPPPTATSLALESWSDMDGTERGILWDRSHHPEDDGEWGDQLDSWIGTLDDALAALAVHGFTRTAHYPGTDHTDPTYTLTTVHRD